MDLVEVRCPKCRVKVGVWPGSTTWHCGQQMVPVEPEEASQGTQITDWRAIRKRARALRAITGGPTDAS